MNGLANWLAVAVGLTVPAALPARAVAQEDQAMSAKIIAWTQENHRKIAEIENFAWHGPAPEVPEPPMVDYPCKKCGSTAPTQGEKDVDAWVAQSMQPEADSIAALGPIARQYEIFEAVPQHELSTQAVHALSYFAERPIAETLQKLVSRLLDGKALPMGRKYDREPKQAYAGVRFLLAAEKQSEMAKEANSTNSEEKYTLSLCKDWMESMMKKIDDDILQGHKYNLCASYASLVKVLAEVGGEAPPDLEDTIGKIDKLMHFQVQMNLHANGQMNDGSHFDIVWTGTAKLRLHVDTGNRCYTPEMENGGQMAVKVQNFSMTGIVKQSDGTTETVPVELERPRSFNVRIQPPLLNLCDPEPILQIPFDPVSFPKETIRAQGHDSPTALFGPFLESVIAPNNINRKETNAVTGASPKVQQTPAPDNNQQQMQAAQAAIQAHKSDVGWLMGPEGQAAIAKLQQAALAQAQGKMSAAGISTPNVSNMQELATSIGAAHLEWTNGSTTPASKTLHADKDGGHFTVTITVTQQPEQ